MSEVASPESEPSAGRCRAWLSSLFFWTGLGAAGVLAALLELSPRLVQMETLQQQARKNAIQLQHAEQELQHLRQLTWGLKNDPEFLTRVALQEFRTAPQGETQISLNPDLVYDPREVNFSVPEALYESPDWQMPVLQTFAVSHSVRTRCYTALILLTLWLFVCCQGDSGGAMNASPLNQFSSRLTQRYRSSSDTDRP
jgi:hypothetical protein